MLRYLSLFSGIGGFELGIKNSKYGDDLVCVGYSEIDKYADSIYSRQFPPRVENGIRLHKPFGDVRHIETSDLPNFELLVGGFPCQAFSNAGKRRGFDDTRGTLFFEIARILTDKRPRYLLLENVKGLLYHNKGETFQTILRILAELGYDVQWEILNSKNVGGVPQNRERIYIKGYLGRECGCEILSKPSPSRQVSEEMNAYTSPTRNCKVVDTGSVSGALTTSGKDSGGNTLVLDRVDDSVSLDCQGVDNSLVVEDSPRVVGNTNPSGKGIGGNVYDSNRLCPCLTVNKDDAFKIAVDKDDCTGTVDPSINIVVDTDYLSNRVVGVDGLSMSLSATNYKHPYRVAVPKEDSDEKIDFDKFFTNVDENCGVTTTLDGDTYAINTKYRAKPFDKYTDNYVRIKNGTKLGYLDAEEEEDGILVGRLHSDTRRGRVQPKSTGALDTQPSWGVYRIIIFVG